MSLYKSRVKKIFKVGLYFIITLLLLLLIPYIICPVYDFEEPAVFKGINLYNPYSEIKLGTWYKANFHAHSKVYFGITNGSLSNSDSIYSIYKRIGYDIPGISNYMSINKDMDDQNGYVPVYEHGFGIRKNHYLVIGAEKVKLIDFFYFQTNNNQQFVINQIKSENNLISIVHPGLRNAVSKEDFSILSNYDCLEAMRYDREYLSYWERALSSGKIINILSNDDSHDIHDEGEVGESFNFVNSKSSNYKDIVNSVRSGNNVGVTLKDCGFNTFGLKAKNIPLMPRLSSFEIKNDSIRISFDSSAVEIKFIGQNGEVKSVVNNTGTANYKFLPEDTYIRTEVIFANRAKYILNPVFRYENSTTNKLSAKVNVIKSILYYVVWFAGIVLVVVYRVKRKRKRKR